MSDLTASLRSIFSDRLKEREPLSKHTNFRIGGPARWFVEVRSVEEMQKALQKAEEAGVPWHLLGGGSNTLAADGDLPILVLQMAMRKMVIHGTCVEAEAGVLSSAFARATVEAGFQGLEWLASVPGTVGGAVYGNAGCFGGETGDRVVGVTVLRKGDVVELGSSDLRFGYRDSCFKGTNDVILRARFQLQPGDPAALRVQMEAFLAKRKASQPLYAGSAGCLFKNVEIQDEVELARLRQETDIPEEMLKNRRLSAGWLVDQLNFKGEMIGQAQISREHGNFILNLGGATASDVG